MGAYLSRESNSNYCWAEQLAVSLCGVHELLEEHGQAHDTHTDTGRLIRVVHDNVALSLMCPVKQSVNRIGGLIRIYGSSKRIPSL